jgi:uncharacterized MAPEG superfamily protein
MKLTVAFRNFANAPTNEIRRTSSAAEFLVFRLLSRVLYIESISPSRWFVFLEANKYIFAADFSCCHDFFSQSAGNERM